MLGARPGNDARVNSRDSNTPERSVESALAATLKRSPDREAPVAGRYPRPCELPLWACARRALTQASRISFCWWATILAGWSHSLYT